jgi:hypothetical protein
MTPSRSVAVRCRILAGGFSGERLVHVSTTDGKEHVSLAPRLYCWTTEGRVLAEDEPKPGVAVEGLVAAHLLQVRDGKMLISLPDGEVILVNKDQVVQRPEETHVSV